MNEDMNEETYWEPDRSRTPVIRHFPEHWYSVRAWPGTHDVEFEVFEMTTHDDGKDIAWGERGASGGPTFCEDMDQSERAFTGSVKWDSCSNWDMQGDDDGMKHFCSRVQAVRIGTMLGICYDLAKELMPQHDYMFD